MYTRTIRSGTTRHPKPKDVLLSLLTRLSEGDHQQGWAHFEWRKHPGWFKNMFRGMSPFVEVALFDDNMVELNFGLPPNVKDPKGHCESKGIPLPESWTMSNRTCKVPISELQSLTDWIQEYFVKVHGCPHGFQVNGYLDGL